MMKNSMIGYQEAVVGGGLRTPAYIFDLDSLDEHLSKVQALVESKVKLCYAMKANPFLTAHIANRLDYVEVCSPGELDICNFYQVPGDKILFSGVNKTKEDIEKALEYRVHVLTVESLKHYMLICECCRALSVETNVYLRLSNGFQFGMNSEVLESIIKNRQKYPYVHILGIHYFAGTQRNNFTESTAELEKLNNYMEDLSEKYDLDLQVLEYGTGLSVPYFTNQNFDAFYDGLTSLTEKVALAKKTWDTVFEMGRFFVSLAADYATSVVDIKHVDNKNYCIVDGGIHQVNYFGQSMALRTPIYTKISSAKKSEREFYDNVIDAKWTVCGSLCSFADVIMKNVVLHEVDIGDVFFFENTGAYSIAEAPILLLNRNLPYVYIYRERLGLQLVKDSEKISGWYCDNLHNKGWLIK